MGKAKYDPEHREKLDQRIKVLEEQHKGLEFMTHAGEYSKEEISLFNELSKEAKKRGVNLSMLGDRIYITLNDDVYVSRMNRGAGRHTVTSNNTVIKNTSIGELDSIYYYSDIVEMLNQNIKDKDIMEIIGMKPATYFRHKKKMMESRFMKMYGASDENTLKIYDEAF